MKKILIVTSYAGNNFGSSLQAFALKEYLKQQGFSSRFVSVKETTIDRCKRFFVRLITGIFNWNLLKKEIRIKFKKHTNNPLINENDTFANERLDILSIKRKELKKLAHSNEITYCIVGSDQIWNPEDAYLDPTIFLKFSPKYKNVAYAASFGQDYIYKYNIKKFKKGLENIKAISCREKSGCDLCEKLGFPSVETLDPTLLFKEADWVNYFNLNKCDNKKRLLLYFVGPIDGKIIDKITRLSKGFDEAVLLTTVNQQIDGVKTVNATVTDFVSFFHNASFVITDSFHGTIFSINFRVPFYTVSRVYVNADGDNNERVLNILNKLSLQDRLLNVNDFNMINEMKAVDYDEIEESLDLLRKKSKEFISKTLV